MATMLGVPHDRRGGRRRRCCSARCARVVDDTFNAITVDGECSTNDCVFALANGASGVDDRRATTTRRCSRRCARSPDQLALGIVRGGEGATKLVTVHVTGAASRRRRVAGGADDRQLAAREDRRSTAAIRTGAGWSRRPADRARRSCSIARPSRSAPVLLFVERRPARRARRRGRRRAAGDGHRRSTVDLGTGGPHDATMWTCDLSAEYVRINAEYRT